MIASHRGPSSSHDTQFVHRQGNVAETGVTSIRSTSSVTSDVITSHVSGRKSRNLRLQSGVIVFTRWRCLLYYSLQVRVSSVHQKSTSGCDDCCWAQLQPQHKLGYVKPDYIYIYCNPNFGHTWLSGIYHSLANMHSCSTSAETQDRKCFSMQLILVVGKGDMINQICQMLSFCWKLLSAYFAQKWLLCFSVSGPSLWNSLPLSVRDPSLTMTQFCTHLKTFLFRGAYCT